MEFWYSSDHHFWHERIIQYAGRPFSNAQEMTEFLVDIHNKYVKPGDHWSCLGDLCMLRGGKVQQDQLAKLVRSMNGQKRLYLGNHDHFPVRAYLDMGFEKVYATNRNDSGIIFSHIPIHPRSMGFSVKANVHGHTHEQPNYDPALFVDDTGKVHIKPYINISVERTDYRPLTLGEIQDKIREVVDTWGKS